jgi:dolichol-phosphate mannosyltransferase
MKITYSVVIPVYNEEEVLPRLHERLAAVLEQLKEPYEIIFVNDGSQDRSYEIMREISRNDNRVKIIDLSRNFGHQTAITAGLDYAAGDAVILMDADLQDPPEVLPSFVEKWREGFDIVYAIRKKRKENILKRLCYKLFYRILRVISDVNIPLDSGDFALLSRQAVNAIRSARESNRFVRGIRGWIGFRQVGIEYERMERYAGEVKYTLSKLMKLAVDGMISFSSVPLRIIAYLGFTISFFSFVYIIYLVFLRLFADVAPQGWTSVMVSIFFVGGIQLTVLGIIGAYTGRIYDEVKRRPLYLIKRAIGFDNPDGQDEQD